MLQESNTAPQLKEWIDRLAPVVEESKKILRCRRPSKLVMYSGCEQDANGNFQLPFFWQEYTVSAQDFTVRRKKDGQEPSSFTQSLILTYLASANGTTPSKRWIGFRELPDGTFYSRAFRGYTGVRLVRQLDGGVEAFCRAGEALDGEPIEQIGDAGYAFAVLPRLHIAAVYWQGDEEFPSQARVLFEDTAAHYMPTDGLAILGSHLVGYVLKAARK
jgi:hypothetical protein